MQKGSSHPSVYQENRIFVFRLRIFHFISLAYSLWIPNYEDTFNTLDIVYLKIQNLALIFDKCSENLVPPNI